MKKETAFRSLVLFAFLSVFLAMSAQDKKESDVAEAQNRTVLENRIWNYDEVVYNTQENTSTSAEGYHFRGTRTIGEHEYSIFRDKDENEIALLREEDRRVYLYCGEDDAEKGRAFHIIFPEDREDTTEALLYDFNLKEGDRFQCVGFDPLDATRGELLDAYITEVSEINVGGETFLCQQFRVDQQGFGEDQMYHYCAVEGVGNADGLLPFPQFGVYANHLSETYHFIRTLTDEAGLVLFSRKDFPKDIAHYDPVPSSSKFNPEDTWEYLWVKRPWIYDYYPDWVNVFPIAFYSPEVVTRDGKEYRRFVWNWKDNCNRNNYPIESYFLLREEDGAYYAYIDPANNDEPEADESKKSGINPGEYLLYDFNMEVGAKYAAPVTNFLNENEGGALLPEACYLADFIVTGKSVDHDGRRVLVIEPDYEQWHIEPNQEEWGINIVEGIGPIYNDCLLTALHFRPQTSGWEPEPFYTLYNVRDEEGEEIFVNPVQTAAGFLAEQDYQWVYGLFDSEGNVSYVRMRFNYLIEDKGKAYRRFKVVALSDNPDMDWTPVDGAVYTVREEEGKIWLLHSANYLELGKDPSVVESLIYDFGAADGEELTFYSPEGEKSAKIATGLTEVGGEDKLSYTFEGSDGVKCVEGIGITKGGILPAVNTEFHRPASADDESFVGAVLVAVYDGDGNLIFRQDLPDAVEAISASDGGFTAPEDRLYDLQGRELREAVPGQPYIKGGKVFVETK